MDILHLIDRYYPVDNPLRQMLLIHSWQVCRKALGVVRLHPELHANEQLLTDGALVHDIGIYLTQAPSIHCHGAAPYLLHGYYGGLLLRREGLPALARICERHTGAGLTREAIIENHLPLPHEDFLPETVEEQIICYADKFYSKSHLDSVRTSHQAWESLVRFGKEGADRFRKWDELFH